ncbi:hypothetical protein AB0E06_39155 [Streptomyces sp. NPDC048109]|uniref:hypothetical protein n=1 Tax=Streptomyces TaxID=1883 RepID=UPI0033F25901
MVSPCLGEGASVVDGGGHGGQYGVHGLVRRHGGNLTDQDVRLWRTVAGTATTTGVALAPALPVPRTTVYAVVAGIATHAAFTCLKPRRPVTFSGLTARTCVAFDS